MKNEDTDFDFFKNPLAQIAILCISIYLLGCAVDVFSKIFMIGVIGLTADYRNRTVDYESKSTLVFFLGDLYWLTEALRYTWLAPLNELVDDPQMIVPVRIGLLGLIGYGGWFQLLWDASCLLRKTALHRAIILMLVLCIACGGLTAVSLHFIRTARTQLAFRFEKEFPPQEIAVIRAPSPPPPPNIIERLRYYGQRETLLIRAKQQIVSIQAAFAVTFCFAFLALIRAGLDRKQEVSNEVTADEPFE